MFCRRMALIVLAAIMLCLVFIGFCKFFTFFLLEVGSLEISLLELCLINLLLFFVFVFPWGLLFAVFSIFGLEFLVYW